MEAVDVRPRGSIQEGTIIAQADTEGVNLSLPRGENGKAIIDHHPIDDREFSWSIRDLRLEDDEDDDGDDGDNKGNVGDENNDSELEASNHLGQIDNGKVKSHRNNDRPVPNLAENDSNQSCARGLGARKDSRNDEGAETFQEQYYRLKFKLAVTGNTTQLKRGDDVRAWLGNIEELCQYYGYNNEDSRMFICSNIKGEVLKSYASAIMKENAECN